MKCYRVARLFIAERSFGSCKHGNVCSARSNPEKRFDDCLGDSRNRFAILSTFGGSRLNCAGAIRPMIHADLLIR